jgi:hypothetical protein
MERPRFIVRKSAWFCCEAILSNGMGESQLSGGWQLKLVGREKKKNFFLIFRESIVSLDFAVQEFRGAALGTGWYSWRNFGGSL